MVLMGPPAREAKVKPEMGGDTLAGLQEALFHGRPCTPPELWEWNDIYHWQLVYVTEDKTGSELSTRSH